MPSLNVQPKDQAHFAIRLDRLRTTIGRAVRSDICLRDPFASRLHAVVHSDANQVMLVDMGSANGTFLNEERVMQPKRLRPGDRIRIGDTVIVYQADSVAKTTRPPVVLTGPDAEAMPDMETTVVSDAASLLISSIQSSRRGVPADVAVTRGKAPTATDPGRRDLLNIISKVGIVLLSQTSLSEALEMTMDLVLEAVPASRGFLFLKDGDEVRCQVVRGLPGGVAAATVHVSRSIVRKALRDVASILTANAAEDPRFRGHGSVQLGAIRSVIAVPLPKGKEAIGVIYVDNPIGNRFTTGDLNVLATIAAVAAIKLENAKLLEHLMNQRRIEEELKVASEIQMRLLPMAPPRIDGWDMTGISLPCREVGGDYYDFIQRKQDGLLTLTLGDVAGKGIGAALLMSSLHAAVRARSNGAESIGQVMAEINQYICENAPSTKFLTLFYGNLDPRTGLLTYSNGGHNPPLVMRRDGEVQRLEAGGLAIGIFPNEVYAEGSVAFQPGDVLLIYSDGISEASNHAAEEFGEKRLIDVLRANVERSAAEIRESVDEALSQFVGAAPPHDDMTLMVVKRSGPDHGITARPPPGRGTLPSYPSY